MAKTLKLPHEKIGLSELAYNLAWTQGYRGDKCHYNLKIATHIKLKKAFNAGKRAAKKGY